MENARNTIQEPGNLRFDVLQQADDPDRFVLYEVYRDEAGMKAHKETPHYARWAEAVAPGWPSRGRASSTRRCFPKRPSSGQRRMLNDEE